MRIGGKLNEKLQKYVAMMLVALLMTLACVGGQGLVVNANGTDITAATAQKTLRKGVANPTFKDKTAGSVSSTDVEKYYSNLVYETTDGGFIAYANMFTQPTDGEDPDVSNASFSQLTPKAQDKFVTDFANCCNDIVEKDKADHGSSQSITNETVQVWWKTLQGRTGMGSKFLSQALADTKPDFVTASKWYKPFSGPIGTLLGFACIVALALIGVVMGSDILYITVPPIRFFVDDQRKEGKIQTSKLFSYAAIHAVKEVEENNKGTHALAIYFKTRVIDLVVLGICLLYLVNGQLYTLVGSVLDMLSGITG